MKLDNEEQRVNLLHVLSEHQISGTAGQLSQVVPAIIDLMRIIEAAQLDIAQPAAEPAPVPAVDPMPALGSGADPDPQP